MTDDNDRKVLGTVPYHKGEKRKTNAPGIEGERVTSSPAIDINRTEHLECSRI